jgi:cobalt-zinc-cadmium efflux system protein
VFVLPRAFSLGRHAVHILLQHAPSGIDVTAVAKSLTDVEDVEEVHDLHIWTLTSGMEVASAHLTVAPGVESPRVLAAAQQVLLERYGLEHATLQVEPPQGEGRCREVTW